MYINTVIKFLFILCAISVIATPLTPTCKVGSSRIGFNVIEDCTIIIRHFSTITKPRHWRPRSPWRINSRYDLPFTLQQGRCKLWISPSSVGADDFFSLSSLTTAAYKILEECVVERDDGVGGNILVGPRAVLTLHLEITVWPSYRPTVTAFPQTDPGEVLQLPGE